MSDANYNGRQPNNSSYIKTFVDGTPFNVWAITPVTTTTETLNVITPVSPLKDIYIPGDLYISGEIIKYHPKPLGQPIITPITAEQSNKILTIPVVQVKLQNSIETFFDINYPELSTMEIMPLLIRKIQDLQEQVNHLSNLLNHNSS